MTDENNNVGLDAEQPYVSPPHPTVPPSHPPAAARARTNDVVSDAASFRELMVSEPLVQSLAAAGFERPSPVQKAAIPLGRVGTDLIVQAKSGTGKTVVFAVICLERVRADRSTTQALVLAPTREIAVQSEQVIRALAAQLPVPTVSSAVFVGGLPMVDDEKKLRRLCHVAVGTPGRVAALLQAERLVPGDLSLLVLDEVDSLLGDSFYEDVTWIYDQLPKRKQVLAFSATYSPELLADLEPLMRRPQRIMMCSETVSLLGVKQFYALVPSEQPAAGHAGDVQGEPKATSTAAAPAVFRGKVQQLLRLLAGVSFHQAAVFCNHKPRAEWLAEQLNSAGYPAAYLSGDRAQTERMEAMAAVKGFKLRVVVSTDVMARGVDLERVNLVVNLDLPTDAATYMHRVGRTGRFGSRGVCVSYVTEAELALLVSYVEEQSAAAAAAAASAAAAAETNGGGGGGDDGEAADPASAAASTVGAATEKVLLPMPEVIPEDLYSYELASDWERQALRQLLQKQQNVQQQQPSAEGLSTCADGSVVSDATALAADGDSTPPPPPPPLVVVELPPLPEEVKAARKAEKAAQEAAKRAEKALRKQQKQEEAQRQQAEQQEQERQAAWSAYLYSGYGTGAYGYGSDVHGRADTPAGASGRSAEPYTANDPWAAYTSGYASYYAPSAGAHDPGGRRAGWQGYNNHSPSGGPYGSHDYYSAYGTYGSYPSATTSQDDVAAAWARYYEQWGGGYGSSANVSYPNAPGAPAADVSGSGQPQGGRDAGSSQQPHDAACTSLRPAPQCPAMVSQAAEPKAQTAAEVHGPGAARYPAPATPAPLADSGGLGGGQDEALDGSDAESELSFAALRGQPAARGRGADVPAVLRRGAGSRHASATAPGGTADSVSPATAADVAAGVSVGQGAEVEGVMAAEEAAAQGKVASAEDGEEEDDSWVLGDEDFSPDAARVVDSLVVLLPPAASERAGPPAAAATAAAAAAASGAVARGQHTTTAPQAAAAEAGAPGGATPAAALQGYGTASRGADGAGTSSGAYYGSWYDPYEIYGAREGSSGYCGPDWQRWAFGDASVYGGGAGSTAQGWTDSSGYNGYGWDSQGPQHYPSVSAAQGQLPNPPPLAPAPPPPHQHHHTPPGANPWYHPYYHHHHQLPHHCPPPHHRHGRHHYQLHPPPHHHQPPPPPAPHASAYGVYGHASYFPYLQYSSQRPEWFGGPTDNQPTRCTECLKRMLHDYVRQQYTWQQAYAAWWEQYKRWYDEWLAEEAGSASP